MQNKKIKNFLLEKQLEVQLELDSKLEGTFLPVIRNYNQSPFPNAVPCLALLCCPSL